MDTPRNRVIITGSSGFVGAHLVQLLIRHGYSVMGIDIVPPTSDKSTDFLFRKTDITDQVSLLDAFAEFSPQTVVHLAARTDLEGDELHDYSANIAGVENLVKCIQVSPHVEKCIITSSQLVCRIGYAPRHDQDYQPNTVYGLSKVRTEQIVRSSEWADVQWCIVRPTTVWGPGMNKHYQSFFRLIRTGRYFHVGSTPLYKTYGYVGNVVYQYLQLLRAPDTQINRQTLYVGDYEPLILQHWINAFQAELGARPISTLPIWAAKIAAWCGDVLNRIGIESFPFNSFRLNNILTEYQFDLTATRQICGELPYNQAQGIRETVRWLVNDVFPEG